ncbi:hypothetical protein J3459_007596 [Metarhizium acridum]|uniref:Protein ECM13 n=1 Tax=Metarhizium acridum (strain CQMa 102) TaxID=655827 RepID=E9E1C8_METAQ|nr:uncharacterized protein MAC_03676 [Metarhizium acridum CQMa 102]EFY90161.1 hypothetical protein MAC_03676 [Metarhizium acridum CQMa 102]KAG8416639.1 hypothetical protein J3458_007209 [Metarhizium acridum]KAG8427013.1 hypothetical protein J3459_007596 [Metarhizium acridum]
MPTAAVAQPQQPALSSTYSHIRSAPKKTMSITQTYYLAHKARAKLSREAAQPDHDLRLLVGHANLLDSLMLELADAEREQERWFNQSVRGASNNTKTADRRVQWADRIVEQPEEAYDEDSSDSDSDSDSDFDEDDVEMTNAVSALVPVAAQRAQLVDEDDEEEMGDDLEEDYAQLELVRTPSHSTSPPELVDHDSESSDDESMPPSPADASLPFNEKEAAKEEGEEIFNDEYYVSQQASPGLVTAVSVY